MLLLHWLQLSNRLHLAEAVPNRGKLSNRLHLAETVLKQRETLFLDAHVLAGDAA